MCSKDYSHTHTGSSWMGLMSTLAKEYASKGLPQGSSSSSTQNPNPGSSSSATQNPNPGSSSSATQNPNQDTAFDESQPQETSTGEQLARACFLECWIGVPVFRLAVNIECGLSIKFSVVAKACFFPQPGAMAKVCVCVCVCMYTSVHTYM
jgi:hypothetical protein